MPHARKYRSQNGAESDAVGISVGGVELPVVVVVVYVYVTNMCVCVCMYPACESIVSTENWIL